MTTGSLESPSLQEVEAEKEPHRIPVLVDLELEEAIGQAAKLFRIGKGPWVRIVVIEKLIEMRLLPPKRKG